MKLTPRQTEVLTLIKRNIDETGYPPTRAEMARKGAIEMVPGASRGIRLPDDPQSMGLPIIGQVAAGNPILAEANIEDYCTLAPEFFSPAASYFLRVRGMSMKNVGIFDGDLLAVHSTQDVRNGQIVVARLGDEVTVKRFKRKGHQVWLLPENESFDPIEVDLREQQLFIEGLGVGVIRKDELH